MVIYLHRQLVMKKRIIYLKRFIFLCLDRRKGGDINGNDFNVPDYLLPNQKDILLTPLFTTNNKANVYLFEY